MSLKTLAVTLSIAGALIGSPTWAQTSTSTSSVDKLTAQYSTLAGSQENANSLIIGLRDGKNVLLTNPTAPSVTFTPPTSKLGYGNINIALSLAKADLARQGITNPTPAQLAAALNGGTIVTATGTVTMAGVLAQRQAGMGWGQIADAMGVKLGSIVSASKTDKAGRKPAPTAKNEVAADSAARGKADQLRTNNKGGNGGGNSSNAGSSSHGGGSSNGGGGGGGRSK